MFDLEAGEVEWLAAVGRRRVRLGPGVRFPLALMGDVDALRRGELQVVDVNSLPRGPEVEALLASGVHVYMVVPMIAVGELIGGVSFGGAPGQFSPEQIAIAQEVAALLAITIAQARLHERVKRQAEELEQRVHERTHELRVANEQLQQEITERRQAEAEADRRSVISCWSCSLATRSSCVRSCTRCSSSSAWRFTRSWRRACAIVMANRAATSCAMAICSGENCPGAPPKLTPPMSSPTAIMGTTMYTWTPEASRASTSGPRGSELTSTTCNSPLRKASTSPISASGKRTPGPRRTRRRPTAASHSTSPASRSNMFTMARGTPSRSRNCGSTAAAIAAGSSAAMIARSISWRTLSRSAYLASAASACFSSVTSAA